MRSVRGKGEDCEGGKVKSVRSVRLGRWGV